MPRSFSAARKNACSWFIGATVKLRRSFACTNSIENMMGPSAQMIELGTIPVDSPAPNAQQHFIDSEIIRWSKVVQLAGIAGTQ
jgi:hypothetical protein